MLETARLDILIYAHDGRGLGHASRSIGVGMALRRLYPALKVLFVSGCNLSQELIGAAPLDWLKLPSYETEVVGGKSRGIPGKSLFSDEQLGQFRARELAHLMSLYRPRLVLVDHTPQGKHKELIPALSAEGGEDTRWVLGVRGVVGSVTQARSELARNLFENHYHDVLWYGDRSVLGASHYEQLRKLYNTVPKECGYVLRLAEFAFWNCSHVMPEKKLAGTLSIPWLGEKTYEFLVILAEALKRIPPLFGDWHLFIGTDRSTLTGKRINQLFEQVESCRLEVPSAHYVSSLLCSKSALIYGGYNSLMDILHTGIPALVVLREMQDEEQQIHLERLEETLGETLSMVPESQVSVGELENLLLANLHKNKVPLFNIKTDGASRAASYLQNCLS